MTAPTRFSNGVTNVGVRHPMGALGFPFPAAWHVYFDDFDRFAAAEWTITTTEAGASSATEALANEDGGVLLVTNDSADNDADFFQKVGESFKFEAGKPLAFAARWKIDDATQSDVVMGLQITDTTPLAVSDGVYFLKSDDAAALSLLVTKNGTSTTVACGNITAEYVETAFFYDGKSEIGVWVNNVKVGTAGVANLPDDEELTISFGVQNGSAAARALSVDYIMAAKKR